VKNKTGSDISSDRFRFFYPEKFKPAKKAALHPDQKNRFGVSKPALN